MPYERLFILLAYFVLFFMAMYPLARAEARRRRNKTLLARLHELQDAKPAITALVDQIAAKDAELKHLRNIDHIWETIRTIPPVRKENP